MGTLVNVEYQELVNVYLSYNSMNTSWDAHDDQWQPPTCLHAPTK